MVHVKWLEISIATTSEGTEIISELLFEAGAKGVVIEDKEDLLSFLKNGEGFDYVDIDLVNSYDSAVKVKGYMPQDSGTSDLLNSIHEQISWLLEEDLGVDIGTGEISLKEIDEQDWAHSWKEYFKPVRVGEYLVVKPTWEEYSSKCNEIVIDMDPGMAFGTGTHETTILCLRALEKYVRRTSSVLDVGCGTGILGIAAILLGAESAVLLDNDPNAVMVAEANSKNNGTYEKSLFLVSDLLEKASGEFDIVIANISSRIIEKMIPKSIDHFKREGYLIFSGILKENKDVIVTALKDNGVNVVETSELGDWVLIVGQHA